MTEDTEYDRAYRLAQLHLSRLCQEEADAQYAAWRKLPKKGQKGQKGPQLRYSATVETLIAMTRDPDLTRERVLAFLHAPETYAYDADYRIQWAGLTK